MKTTNSIPATFTFPNTGIVVNGLQIENDFYFAGRSTWHTDHGALIVIDTKTGKRTCEWNYHREMDSTTPELLEMYEKCALLKN